MFKTESKRIGAHDYKVTQLDAIKGRRVFTRLARLLTPALAKMKGGEDAWSEALVDLMSRISDEDMDYFCDTFAQVTSVSGGEYNKASPQLDAVFQTHFAGDYFAMSQWLIFCFQVNFQSFFGAMGLRAVQVQGKAAAGSDSNSPTE